MAGTLSGGEQQMLAMGRALMSKPKAHYAGRALHGPGSHPGGARSLRSSRHLHKAGTTILLVEQNAQAALSVADRGYVHGDRQDRRLRHRRRAAGFPGHQEGLSGRLSPQGENSRTSKKKRCSVLLRRVTAFFFCVRVDFSTVSCYSGDKRGESA